MVALNFREKCSGRFRYVRLLEILTSPRHKSTPHIQKYIIQYMLCHSHAHIASTSFPFNDIYSRIMEGRSIQILRYYIRTLEILLFFFSVWMNLQLFRCIEFRNSKSRRFASVGHCFFFTKIDVLIEDFWEFWRQWVVPTYWVRLGACCAAYKLNI